MENYAACVFSISTFAMGPLFLLIAILGDIRAIKTFYLFITIFLLIVRLIPLIPMLFIIINFITSIIFVFLAEFSKKPIKKLHHQYRCIFGIAGIILLFFRIPSTCYFH